MGRQSHNALKYIADKLGWVVNRTAVSVQMLIKNFVYSVIKTLCIHHKYVVGKILGLTMKAGRERNAIFMAVFCHITSGEERNHNVYSVNPI